MPPDRNENKTEKSPEASTFAQRRLDLVFDVKERQTDAFDGSESGNEAQQEAPQDFVDRLNVILKEKGKGTGRVTGHGPDGALNELVDAGTGLTLRNTQELRKGNDSYVYKVEYYLSFSFETKRWSVRQVITAVKNKQSMRWPKDVPVASREDIVDVLKR